MDQYDVIIAGGGPAGCFTAAQLASKETTVAVIEEHNTVGEPLHCAGLVTKRVFDITNCPQTGIVQNKIYGAHIHGPDGKILTIGGDKLHALVIDRQRFDSTLAQAAQDAGADILTGHKVTSAQRQDTDVLLTMKHEEQPSILGGHLLIGADGPHSRVRNIFEFPKPTEFLQGIGGELTETSLEPRFVHIFVGQAIAPGFFAWVIPTNQQGTTARVGLCFGKKSSHPLQFYLANLLQQQLLQDATLVRRFGGTIPLGPLKTTIDDNVMLVGDAAAQVKPTSGGGLYPGLLCSTYCAQVAREALQKHMFTRQTLKQYHMKWTKDIGRELSLGMRFRKIFRSLTDAQINKSLEKLNNDKTIDVINTHGDIDYPSRLALPLLRTSPSLLSLAPTILRRTKK